MFARRVLLLLPGLRTTTTRSFVTTTTTTCRQAPVSLRPRARHLHGNTFPSLQRPTPNETSPWQQIWRQGQERGYRQAFNYQRFSQTKSLFRRWAARPTFYVEVGGLGAVCGGFYLYNLEAVPVSGRRHFNVISPDYERKMGDQAYAQTLQEFGNKLMPPSSQEYRMVQRVLNRLLPHSGLEGENWEINVINDDTKNAFVIPGGKVFVFRGILDICQGEDGLAAVLGHEIAHNVAHHAAERMSQAFILLPIAIVGSLVVGLDPSIGNWLQQLLFQLPGSRKQEEEADYIGLLMMSESCYNPEAAMGLWSRMEQAEKGQAVPPQFLSTHPSSHNRLEKIRGWLPQAEVKFEAGDCQTIAPYASDFKSVAGNLTRWR